MVSAHWNRSGRRAFVMPSLSSECSVHYFAIRRTFIFLSGGAISHPRYCFSLNCLPMFSFSVDNCHPNLFGQVAPPVDRSMFSLTCVLNTEPILTIHGFFSSDRPIGLWKPTFLYYVLKSPFLLVEIHFLFEKLKLPNFVF